MTFSFGPGFRFIEEVQEPTRIQKSGGEEACFRLAREMVDLPVIARFTIEGEPCSKARARFTKQGSRVFAYTPEKTKQAEGEVARLFRKSVAGDYDPGNRDITYGVMALFFHGNRQRRDVDNMLKLILDGLNKIAWPDDEQVIEISGRKALVPSEDARTEVVVYRVGYVQRHTMKCERCEKEFPVSLNTKRRFCSRECVYERKKELHAIICETCGKRFFRNSNPKSRYCSSVCAQQKVSVTCNECGKEITRYRYRVREENFCSGTCRDSFRAEVRALAARGVCEQCGKPTSKKEYVRCMEHRRSKWDNEAADE